MKEACELLGLPLDESSQHVEIAFRSVDKCSPILTWMLEKYFFTVAPIGLTFPFLIDPSVPRSRYAQALLIYLVARECEPILKRMTTESLEGGTEFAISFIANLCYFAQEMNLTTCSKYQGHEGSVQHKICAFSFFKLKECFHVNIKDIYSSEIRLKVGYLCGKEGIICYGSSTVNIWQGYSGNGSITNLYIRN